MLKLSVWASGLAYLIGMAQVTTGQDYCEQLNELGLEPCTCGTALDCSLVTSGDQLLTIPGLQNGGSVAFEFILLRNNDQIVEIPDSAFGAHYATRFYDFSSNPNLKRIGRSVISQNSASRLRQIAAANNSRLDSFPFEDIRNFRDLSNINLSDNNLQEIPPRAFAEANSSVTGLVIENNNISSIGADAFTGLKNLGFLSLRGNKLTTVSPDAFKFSSRPSQMVLANNEIKKLEEGDFINFPLRTLMAYNEIETLEQSTWEKRLEELLGTEGYINIEGNPIVCDCRLEWLYKRPEFRLHILEVLCRNPEGSPTDLWEMDETFFENC